MYEHKRMMSYIYSDAHFHCLDILDLLVLEIDGNYVRQSIQRASSKKKPFHTFRKFQQKTEPSDSTQFVN